MSPEEGNIDWPMPSARPEEVGMSSEYLSRIRPHLQRFITREMAPSFVSLVARHGKVVHHEVQGYMDFESKKPATLDTIYRLYSNTKPITGVAAMICVEEGLLSLDDPVSKYIPAYKNQRVRAQAGQGPMLGTPTIPVNRDITIRDCLRNTTGITTARRAPLAYMNEFGELISKAGVLAGPVGNHDSSVREMVEALAQLPLESQPGTEFEYHVGYPIAGVVLEIVTGQTLEEFYHKRIFQPLGMKDTSVYLDKDKLSRFPALYSPVLEEEKWKLAVTEEPAKSPKVTRSQERFDAGGGDGGLLSTAADYARFAQMLLNGGGLDGVRIISRKSVELMTGSHTGDIEIQMPGFGGFGFGIGVGVYKGGGEIPIYRSVGTYGWGGAAGTSLFVDPKEELICVCFSQIMMHQVMGNNTYLEDFERLVYQSIL